MSRARQTFRQNDLAKALKAAAAAGVPVARFEIDRDGKIIVVAGKAEQDAAVTEVNEWDTVK
jgi:hypothetical protein